MPLPISNQ